ncbi:MAG: M23 family metallopeptidase [Gammaproteobacteria bacterium]|nr:M23 family metallopeptidase [Gammaproteobacteria bacterium]
MTPRPHSIVLALCLAAVAALSACSMPREPATADIPPAPPAIDTQYTPVTARVLAAPVPVPGTDGRVHLAYELALVNHLSQPAKIASLRVTDGTRALLSLTPDALKPRILVQGKGFGETTIGPGQQAVVWLHVPLPDMASVPDRVQHVLTLDFASPKPPLVPARLEEVVAVTRIDRTPPVVIGPPLAGPRWLNGNSCCEMTPHRMAVSPINGDLWAAERYAIDYVKLDAAGRMFTGDITRLSSYPSYGEKVYAVADGKVVAMLNTLRESTPGANPTGLAIGEYGGNYVVQDIGSGRYAFYAHLQAGNPYALKVGQSLKRGQPLGLLGNTGNSDAPHLHFHVMDSPEPLASNGLPFVFDSFAIEGHVMSDASLAEGGSKPVPFQITRQGAGERRGQMPLHRDVMGYPAR